MLRKERWELHSRATYTFLSSLFSIVSLCCRSRVVCSKKRRGGEKWHTHTHTRLRLWINSNDICSTEAKKRHGYLLTTSNFRPVKLWLRKEQTKYKGYIPQSWIPEVSPSFPPSIFALDGSTKMKWAVPVGFFFGQWGWGVILIHWHKMQVYRMKYVSHCTFCNHLFGASWATCLMRFSLFFFHALWTTFIHDPPPPYSRQGFRFSLIPLRWYLILSLNRSSVYHSYPYLTLSDSSFIPPPHILLKVLRFVILHATQKYLAFMARKGGDGAAKGRASTSTFHLMQLDNAIAFATGVPSRLDPSRLLVIIEWIDTRSPGLEYHHFRFHPWWGVLVSIEITERERWRSHWVPSTPDVLLFVVYLCRSQANSLTFCHWVTRESQPTKLTTFITLDFGV